MSSRHVRKLLGNNSLPPVDSDDSDDDYAPVGTHQNKFTYEGLILSSGSERESEPDVEDEEESQEPQVVQSGARKKKGKGKGKKTKNAVNDTENSVDTSKGTSNRNGRRRKSRQSHNELDEIDKCLMEVNAMLGAPPPAPVEPEESKQLSEIKAILSIQAKHLNVSNEFRKLFGPDTAQEIRVRAKTQPHRARVLKRAKVTPNNETNIYDFKKSGLSMSIRKEEGNVIYFAYDHDKDYQRMHITFMMEFTQSILTRDTSYLNMEAAKKYMHVEQLLEIAGTLFLMDESSMANEIVENVVAYLQYVSHPSFVLDNMNVRLPYDYIENRPFHSAMLRYMYLLTNKACHRTALEIAKVLLNIDPSDPLAVLFIIDTLAIRAREYQWLIDAVEYFTKQRQADLLFNIKYSLALAHFHVATKNKGDLTVANKLLQHAIMAFPEVLLKLYEYANFNDPLIHSHRLFTEKPVSTPNPEDLGILIMIYTKFIWSRWKVPEVMSWLNKNAKELIIDYENNPETRERTAELRARRRGLFQAWPKEIVRHVVILRSMSNLLLETSLAPVTHVTSNWDPIFDYVHNRYSYANPAASQQLYRQIMLHDRGQTLLYRFITSIIPDTEDMDPPAPHQQ